MNCVTAGIYRKIAAVEYTPLPDCFSSGLQDLVRSLLAKETKQRPSVSETLDMPYVRQVGRILKAVTTAQPGRQLGTLSNSERVFHMLASRTEPNR